MQLKEKLLSYSYCQSIIGWITEFLTNRTQCLRVNQAASSTSNVTSGIVLGSSLGPALIVLYIYDLPEVCSNVSVKLYADDIKVYKMITYPVDLSCLQLALNSIENWSCDWQLQFFVEKMSALTIRLHGHNIFYYLGKSILAPVSNNKYLGFSKNYTLKLSLHIYNIVRKVNIRVKLILKCFHSCDPAVLIKAFNTYVRPLLEYGISK